MPRFSIKLNPGIVTTQTPTLNETGWSAGQNIRFFQGQAQKDNGWVDLGTATGIVQALRAWTALSGISYLGIGGSTRLQVMLSGQIYDITPVTIVTNLTVSMDTTSGSPNVVIHDATDTPSANSWIQVVNPISVGGITIRGVYQLAALGVNTYTIVAAQNATSNVSTGGITRIFNTEAGDDAVLVTQPVHNLFTGQVTNIPISTSVGGLTLSGNYLVTVTGPNTYTISTGNPATSTASASENSGQVEIQFFAPASGGTQNNILANVTSLDNWGEFLLYAPGRGPLNVWMPSQGITTPASNVSTAPQAIGTFFVSIQVQQVICCGATNLATGIFDPMLMRWSDTGDYTSWTPLATNQAGSFRLAIGSSIMAGMAVQSQNLIWTDLALYSMQYIQFPLVWGFQPLGINCGAVGPHAVGNLAGTVSWMSFNQFMTLTGNGPVMIDCPVWDQVFPNLDRAHLNRVVCETDSYYGEIAWSVPQNNGTFVFARMRTDPATGVAAWTVSTYHHHTAWIDQSVLGAPIGGHENGIIDQHDTGFDAGVGQPLPTSLTSGIVALSEATDTMFIRDFIPDIEWAAPGTLNLFIYAYDQPLKPPRVHGPFALSSTGPNIVNLHARGRGIQFQFQGNDVGSNWRLGNCRYWAQPDGHR